MAGVILIDDVPAVNAGIAPSRRYFITPIYRLSNISAGGMQKTSRPCSMAFSAVISAPLLAGACMTKVPMLNPDSTRFRKGKFDGAGDVPGRNSDRIEATPGNFIFQIGMGLGICNIQSAAHQRNAGLIRLQRTAVRRDVDAHGISRHRNKSHLHQIVADGLFHLETVRRGIAEFPRSSAAGVPAKGSCRPDKTAAPADSQWRAAAADTPRRRTREWTGAAFRHRASISSTCASPVWRMRRSVCSGRCSAASDSRLLQHLHRFLG